MKKNWQLDCLGSEPDSRKVFELMRSQSPAYARHIGPLAQKKDFSWGEIPLLTKKSFYAQHSWREIVPRSLYADIYSVQRSSGSSSVAAKGFFWPQLKSQARASMPYMESSLRSLLDLENRKTLVIIGLSLGSWAGGEQFSFLFKTLATNSAYRMVVFSPGNQHAEICEILEQCQDEFDQIVIALCPSAIFYLEKLAEQNGQKLPLSKISFLVTGEPFSESLRQELDRRRPQSQGRVPMLSVYGSADTGVLGVESPPLIEVRKFLSQNVQIRHALGFESTVPNFYHAFTGDTFLENVKGELVITRLQGIPLVRYNLEDAIELIAWKPFCQAIAQVSGDAKFEQLAALALPDLVAVSGRTQGCAFLCGSNIFESMLEDTVLQSSLRPRITGRFVTWVDTEEGRQVLHFQIELSPGAQAPLAAEIASLHHEFVESLSRSQPEFGEDYEKFYRPFEKEGLQIFRFHFNASPFLENHPRFRGAIKRKIILPEGPLL